MCGILGVIGVPEREQISGNAFVAMRDTMINRGPDGAGVFRHANTTLGHRRLAIRGLKDGQQPWVSQNGRFALVYNGEIYNDDALADELGRFGIQLRTSCDTEVLAECWSMWGVGCLEKLRGMFAFGVVDLHRGRTWLVRDRFGIKPLYYAQVNRELVFASSIKAIRRHPRFSSRPNLLAVSHYLQTLRSTVGRETFFEDVYTVQPGEILTFEDERITTQTYWSVPPQSNDTEIEFAEAADELQSLLTESVNMHLKSDVNVGMMMSGGVDSNTLAALIRRNSGRSLPGVCGGGLSTNEGPAKGSDFQFAEECARMLQIDYSEVQLTGDDYLIAWDELLGCSEVPLTTPSDAIIYRIAQRLKQHCGVAIGGEGADEVFCGYEVQHWSGNDFDRAQDVSHLTSQQQTLFRQSMMQQYGRSTFGSIAEHYLSSNGLIPWNAQQVLFRPEFTSQELPNRITSYYQNLFNEHQDLPTAQRYSAVLLRVNLESLLMRLDSATMAAGLEARVPYADHILLQQASKFPHEYKIDVDPSEINPWLGSQSLSTRGTLRPKRILRNVAARMMPPKFAQRPKKSFPTPLVPWLNGNWSTWMSAKFKESPFANYLFKESSLAEVSQLPPNMALWKWPLINTIMWGERCFA